MTPQPDEAARQAALSNLDALRAAREWATDHRHSQPDDRMLAAYGALVYDAAYRAGQEHADRIPEGVRRAVRRLCARIIASARLLDVPFTDAPDRSPWTEMKRDMAALYEAVGIRFATVPAAAPREGVDQ